MLILLAS